MFWLCTQACKLRSLISIETRRGSEFSIVGPAQLTPMQHQNAAVLVMIFDVLSARRATEHVHSVVVTTKQSVGAEIASLFASVTCDVSGKDHFQPPLSFAVFPPKARSRRSRNQDGSKA
jgi:hypothetical protein